MSGAVKLLHLDPLLREAGHYEGRNFDAEVASVVRRLIDVEERIDLENKRKAMIYAEAKIGDLDIGALKAVVRTIRYMPQSEADGLHGLSEIVKRYLDLAIGEKR
ncbi:hypothetical protein [Mesorhizobium sp. A556]